MNDDDGGPSFNTAASRRHPLAAVYLIRHWYNLDILTVAGAQNARVKKLSMKILHKL
ncbi:MULTISPECIES: hypothetical protein [unclassified Bradyrhizobium]|uniref:hypothetical protein n=1 Tax=unclassified Bradyrhizobium TaxID=2631580 RepID=UPI001BAACE7C|nr:MULTISPECIES: hypothetical protein [unclassified Bradyrhizobium]MBR1202236.1 hypothetical protein [Bradyrhizobium sp. AUGA SZCCT0124]MBR1311195.1 hypothetical protein [Bradyrhizobium sp. AUGA SZCCT0051]MBR1339185.1 hypothetical protein [Bradyrhizobium sp. AUGA SZCCT0105]MBR1353759.1 hypothetical protein [Bradyrhizobium sp. AUGA SZCCT0045]